MPALDPIRILIVDDEEPARALVREYLSAHPGIEIVGEAPNGFEAVRLAGELKPDLLFLDVRMPKLDGFEALELIGEGPEVIFITAYDEHALRAFEVHAVDYLLKPVAPERLAEALNRARTRLTARSAEAGIPPGEAASGARSGQEGPSSAVVMSRRPSSRPASAAELAAAARGPDRHLERIVLRDGARIHVLAVTAVDAIEAEDDYVRIHSAGKSWLKQQTLATLEASLDPARFPRVHRSWIVNIDRLARLEPWAKDGHVAILADGRRVPVSRAGYARLKMLL